MIRDKNLSDKHNRDSILGSLSRVLILVAYLLTFLVGVAGNALVLGVVVCHRQLRAKSVANYYIGNLALADLSWATLASTPRNHSTRKPVFYAIHFVIGSPCSPWLENGSKEPTAIWQTDPHAKKHCFTDSFSSVFFFLFFFTTSSFSFSCFFFFFQWVCQRGDEEYRTTGTGTGRPQLRRHAAALLLDHIHLRLAVRRPRLQAGLLGPRIS